MILLTSGHSLRAMTATNALSNDADIAKVREWLWYANVSPALQAKFLSLYFTAGTSIALKLIGTWNESLGMGNLCKSPE